MTSPTFSLDIKGGSARAIWTWESRSWIHGCPWARQQMESSWSLAIRRKKLLQDITCLEEFSKK
jgi:hypothetical protein